MSNTPSSEIVSNRKAFHNYEILETLEAGIVLLGTEIKSLRDHGGNLSDAYIIVNMQDQVVLKGAQISPYRFGNIHNHEEKRDRLLLLHKREILKLKAQSTEKGHTLVPLSFYFKNGKVKVKIGIAKGKKLYDKRASLKEKEHQRLIQKSLKGES